MLPRTMQKVIGYYGFPRRSVLADARRRFGNECPLVDLDVDRGAPDAGLLPATTCRIIANIVDNAAEIGDGLAAVVAAVGEDKCDRGRHAARLLNEMGFVVIESRFPPEEFETRPLVYAVGRGDLTARVNSIMETVVFPGSAAAPPEPAGQSQPAPPPEATGRPQPAAPPEPVAPTHGFWGVPPHDPRVLGPFPPTTHIYGWTRCVEAGRPGDTDLECFVDRGVPTVFFTQSFCAKQDLAHHLAAKHGGLAIDCHGAVNDSILAKIEAFVRLA